MFTNSIKHFNLLLGQQIVVFDTCSYADSSKVERWVNLDDTLVLLTTENKT